MNRSVAFYTLGCKLNFSETSTIARLFEDAGFARVNFDETPDIYIINTCSVTENADKKCKQLVKYVGEKYPDKENVQRLVAGFNPKKIMEKPMTACATAFVLPLLIKIKGKNYGDLFILSLRNFRQSSEKNS